MWTITTDPKLLSPDEALKTINHRWDTVNRSLKRLAPDIRYFRVIELTQSGLPHMHVIFDRYVPWGRLQAVLQKQLFGEVLHFKKIPLEGLFSYVTKYLTKTLQNLPRVPYRLFRVWSASVGFLPAIVYHDPEGDWELLEISSSEWWADRWEHDLRIYLLDHDHP